MNWFTESGRIISGSPPVKAYHPLEKRPKAIWSPASTLPKKNKTTEKKSKLKSLSFDHISDRCGIRNKHDSCRGNNCTCWCHTK